MNIRICVSIGSFVCESELTDAPFDAIDSMWNRTAANVLALCGQEACVAAARTLPEVDGADDD